MPAISEGGLPLVGLLLKVEKVLLYGADLVDLFVVLVVEREQGVLGLFLFVPLVQAVARARLVRLLLQQQGFGAAFGRAVCFAQFFEVFYLVVPLGQALFVQLGALILKVLVVFSLIMCWLVLIIESIWEIIILFLEQKFVIFRKEINMLPDHILMAVASLRCPS